MGRLGPALDSPQPCQIQNTRQHAGPHLPTACPHCHAERPMWTVDAYQGFCRCCGATFFKADHLYQSPPAPRWVRPVWLRGVRTAR
jgi:hypothetical protein